jgi:hypothetical protein
MDCKQAQDGDFGVAKGVSDMQSCFMMLLAWGYGPKWRFDGVGSDF